MRFERQYTEPEISFSEWIAQQGIDTSKLARDSDYAELIGGAFTAASQADRGKLKAPARRIEYTDQLKRAYQEQIESGAIRSIAKSQPLNWENKADQAYARMQIKRVKTPELKTAWQNFYDSQFQITPEVQTQISTLSPPKRNLYDLDRLKSIPIQEVAQAFGVQVKKVGNDYWCAIRDERTPSCKLYGKTNTFCDFGAANYGGDTIELTAFLNSCSRADAIEKLAQTFGILPEQQNGNIRRLPSARQFAKIGIYADVATKNFDFHIEKYGIEGAQKISDKYHMSVEKLADLYPDTYHQMLRAKAVPYVQGLRSTYLQELWWIHFNSTRFGFTPEISSDIFDEARDMLHDAETGEHILREAIQDSKKVPFQTNQYNLSQDFAAVSNGKLSVELINTESIGYRDLKSFLHAEAHQIASTKMSASQYSELWNSLSDITAYSAFAKGDTITVAYDADFSQQVNDLINFSHGEPLAEITESIQMQMLPSI